MRTDELFAFVLERHRIYKRRQAGKPKPWTRDPILQAYRFTNIYREMDKVTIWIRENWRAPHLYDPHIWFAMAVARYINWPQTLYWIGYPVPWRPEAALKTMLYEQSMDRQVFGGAYFLNSIGPKIECIINDRLTPLWDRRENICQQLKNTVTLSEVYNVLREQKGFGSFMAAQVIADIKYVPRYRPMPDWWTWAASGPGSRRGLNRVMDRPVNASWTEAGWFETLTKLREEVLPLVRKTRIPQPHAQDVQSWLCEFDKYERVRLREGRPKQKFQGA